MGRCPLRRIKLSRTTKDERKRRDPNAEEKVRPKAGGHKLKKVEPEICMNCFGQGIIEGNICHKCYGTGETEEVE